MATSFTPDPGNTCDLDFASQEFKANARQHLAEWATRPPFYVMNNGPPQVVVGRYADVQEVFTDWERFSSEVPLGHGYEQFDKFKGSKFVTQMDGEQHTRLRRLMGEAFTIKRVAQIESRITEIVESLLDDIASQGPAFDGMRQYAARLVVGVLLTAMMNLDEDQKRILLEYQEVQPQLTSMKPGQPFAPEVLAAYDRMAALVRALIADRRANPRSDFLGDLVSARYEGDRLDDQELFDMIFGTCAAIATTPRSGAGALYALYSHPDQVQQLIADPSLIPDALDECLRIAGNGYFTFPRIATCDTEVGGTKIVKGMIVRPSPQAANYDPTVFPDPLRFDIHRRPQRIMTFAVGRHHCIGAVLARATLQTAVRRLLARFPEARLADPSFRPSYGGAVGELRMVSLPMLAA